MKALFDGHCDTVSGMHRSGSGIRENGLHVSLEKASGIRKYAQFFALWSTVEDCRERDMMEELIKKLKNEIDKYPESIILCGSSREAEAAMTEGKVAAFVSVEGAHMLDCEPERIEEAWRQGVRALGLTWNNANELSGTNAEESERGLSGTGREFVRRCNEKGIIVDVSHISDKGFWDVSENTSAPFIASHSNSRTVWGDKRNLTDEQYKAIIEAGGVAGINLYADFIGERADIAEVVKHVLHFLELGGEKNIAIGADFDGCERLCEGITGIGDMWKIYEALLDAGISEGTADDIFYNNMMRVVREVCGI